MSIYKGGYLTIDCGGEDIATESGITVSGVYNAVKETFGKVVILSNVTIGSLTAKYYVFDNLAYDSDNDEYSYVNGTIAIVITNTNVIYAIELE